jgi:hypothetical protein
MREAPSPFVPSKKGGDSGSAAPRKNNGRGRSFYIPAPYLVAADQFRPLATPLASGLWLLAFSQSVVEFVLVDAFE